MNPKNAVGRDTYMDRNGSWIVVGKDTQTVQVQVHSRDGNTYENSVETWTVVRTPEHPDRTTLKRPSGEYVMGAGYGNVSPTKKDSGQ